MKKPNNKTKTILLRVTPRLYEALYKRSVLEEKSVPEVIREITEVFK